MTDSRSKAAELSLADHRSDIPLLPINQSTAMPATDAHAASDAAGESVPFAGTTADEEPHRLTTAPPGATLCGVRISKGVLLICGITFIVGCGLILGLTVKPPGKDPAPWDHISGVIGWWYFMAWAVSFLPQLYLNYTRKCVVGQSFDYVFLNILGFSFYSIYTVAFFFVDRVQLDYKERFGNQNDVQANDVAFAVYAAACCYFNGWQIWRYDRGSQRLAPWTIAAVAIVLVVFVIWLIVLLAGVRTDVAFNTLDILYGLSMVKLGVSIVKYLPQIYLNYARRSTIGWNIWNVLLDFSGGFLSVSQQLIDCGTTGRWNGIAGNPVKFGLGSFSMLYDIIFMVQHYCLYARNNAAAMAKEDAVRAAYSSALNVD